MTDADETKGIPEGIEEEPEQVAEDNAEQSGDDNNVPDAAAEGESAEQTTVDPLDELAKRRMERLGAIDPSDFPQTYCSSSPDEELVMDYLDDFRRQFVQLYPDRSEPLLELRNECGVPKPICTFVRPTLASYKQMYDLKWAIQFMADFVEYEPLPDPLKISTYGVSPSTVLDWQMGDCLDMANTVCSFLIGSGFDAYVVLGYAPITITRADQSRTDCPYSEEMDGASIIEDAEETDDLNGKYSIRPRPQVHSLHLLRRAKLDKLNSAQRKIDEEEAMRVVEKESEIVDDLDGKRIHCWVLVRSGSREIPRHMCIEPSTGSLWPLEDCPYFGAESIWNHSNIWVNMGNPKTPFKDVNLDLNDNKDWEYVFMDAVPKDPFSGTSNLESSGDLSKTVEDAETGEVDVDDNDEDIKIVELPASWVSPVAISRDKFVERFAAGSRTKRYRRCIVEEFSWNARSDGMCRKLTLFTDLACTNVKEIREYFAARKDGLRLRLRYPSTGKVISKFGKDRQSPLGDALKEIVEIGELKEYKFFHTARTDGKKLRKEMEGKKVIEEFEGRDDRMEYRSITYYIPEPGEEITKQAPGMKEIGRPVVKMCQKFEKLPSGMDSSDQVRCQRYFLQEDRIHLDYHYGKGKITASSKTYTKDKDAPRCVAYESDSFAEAPNASAEKEEYERLLAEEKALLLTFKEEDRDLRNMLEQRRKEEEVVEVVPSLREQLKAKLKQDALKPKEEKQDVAVKADYLAPFWPKNTPKDSKLNLSAANDVKERCLKALKERLIDRAHIIESRLEEEQQALARRQAGFQRQDKDKAAEEEHERYVQSATFRIQILKQRRDRHEELAKQKFRDMIAKLQADDRLSAMLPDDR